MDKKSTIVTKSFYDFDVNTLKHIASIHLDESIILFKEKSIHTKNDEGKWYELIYCILAGTQFPVNKLKPIYYNLIHNNKYLININSRSLSKEELADFLLNSGYRYYNQKANTIVLTANYFRKYYNSKPSILFKECGMDSSIIREYLINNINGIGIKIASHWLRNIGFDICTIDIHLRRLLFNLNISDEDTSKPINNYNFKLLENHFRDLSKITNIPIHILQYSIWEYVRSHCNNNLCIQCKLKYLCKKGLYITSSTFQLNIFK